MIKQMSNDKNNNDYLQQYQGGFYGVLRWHQLDEVWDKLKQTDADWYIYQIGEAPPEQTATYEHFCYFIDEIDVLLKKEHEENYCGIVYIDDKVKPSFIKIYDPSNLGSSCGSSGGPPPLPGWTLSQSKPQDLKIAFPVQAKRKRWWKKLFS